VGIENRKDPLLACWMLGIVCGASAGGQEVNAKRMVSPKSARRRFTHLRPRRHTRGAVAPREEVTREYVADVVAFEHNQQMAFQGGRIARI
jgi:hypothetical protein